MQDLLRVPAACVNIFPHGERYLYFFLRLLIFSVSLYLRAVGKFAYGLSVLVNVTYDFVEKSTIDSRLLLPRTESRTVSPESGVSTSTTIVFASITPSAYECKLRTFIKSTTFISVRIDRLNIRFNEDRYYTRYLCYRGVIFDLYRVTNTESTHWFLFTAAITRIARTSSCSISSGRVPRIFALPLDRFRVSDVQRELFRLVSVVSLSLFLSSGKSLLFHMHRWMIDIQIGKSPERENRQLFSFFGFALACESLHDFKFLSRHSFGA